MLLNFHNSHFALKITTYSFSGLAENYKRAKPSRTSIMAFPRVGRSETMEWGHEDGWNVQKKSNTGSSNNGLWFGPRLGRIHKRQDYKSDIPLAYFYISGKQID